MAADAVAADEDVGGDGWRARAVVKGAVAEEGCGLGHGCRFLTHTSISVTVPILLVMEAELPRGDLREKLFLAIWPFGKRD